MKNPYKYEILSLENHPGDARPMISPYEDIVQDRRPMSQKFIENIKVVQSHSLVKSRPLVMVKSILKSVCEIKRLNNALCLGETYCLLTATENDSKSLNVEYFLFAQFQPEKLHNNATVAYKKHVADEFTLSNYLFCEQGKVDNLIENLLRERADELHDSEVAWSHEHNLAWTPTLKVSNIFQKQIEKVLALTDSPALKDCLNGMAW